MKCRLKDNPHMTGDATNLNTSALDEIVAGFVWDDPDTGEKQYDMDSVFFHDLDVYIEVLGEWKDLIEAFRNKDVITNNYNTRIHEPRNEEERKRGYSL